VCRDAGCHTRTAVGMAALPFDIAIEIEMTARVRD
jgi:enamine deaminase RidA (YjgF/YER057c/UK114 family)